MKETSLKNFHYLSRLATILALVVTISVPAVYFALSYQHHVSSLQTEVDITAEYVTKFINSNPQLWMYLDERLADVLSRKRMLGEHWENRRIVGIQGEMYYNDEENPPFPVISVNSTIYDAGVVGSAALLGCVTFFVELWCGGN